MSLRPVNLFLACALFGAFGAVPALAEQSTPYIAIALVDGPTPAQRTVTLFRGTDPKQVVTYAYTACFERAAEGYRHTCKVGFGNAWLVGEMCMRTPMTPVFDIEDDANSAEAAKMKALQYLGESEHVDVSTCRDVAVFNANDMQSARSVAKTTP